MSTILPSSLALPASIPSPPAEWAKFELGPLVIYAYALCILLGIVLALLLTQKRFTRYGGNGDAVWDVAIWAIPFGIIGGRMYHVFSSPDAYFGPDGDPVRAFYIWQGGLGIWGAVALGAVGAWIGCRRAGVRLAAFADAAAPGLLLAQAVGRWGNWFNQELFGGPTDLPWGLEIDPSNANFPADADPGTLFHPTFLYESLWNLAGVAILLLLDRRFRLRGGRMFWLYAAYYTLGRVWIETLRIDDAEMVSLFGVTQRLNVWTSILIFLVAIAILIYLTLRQDRKEAAAVYLAGHEPAAKEDQEVPGTDAGGLEGPESATAASPAEQAPSAGNDRGNLSETKGSSPAPVPQDPAKAEPRD